jgi:diketogulonate reductase-like aldo/keto reductase
MRRISTITEELLEGRASAAGTARNARHGDAYTDFRGLHLSRIGLGTSLRTSGDGRSYLPAVIAALARGVNVVDTAISYGGQTCERACGEAFRYSFAKGVARDEVFVE